MSTQADIPLAVVTAAIKQLHPFINPQQMRVMADACRGEERDWFKAKLLELQALIASMPKTYEQDGKGDQAVISLHYFTGGCDWWITEKDAETPDQPGQHQAFGLADLGYGAELGYISIVELLENGAELDLHFPPRANANTPAWSRRAILTAPGSVRIADTFTGRTSSARLLSRRKRLRSRNSCLKGPRHRERKKASGLPQRMAHIVAYELFCGHVPRGKIVCHKCDNPSCINPGHLFCGTHHDNTQDMLSKGRFNPPIGERQGASKLTRQQVREIANSTCVQEVMAAKYGISKSTVSLIRSKKRWKFLW